MPDLLPATDTALGSWTVFPSGTASSVLDEVTPDDTDYVQSYSLPSGQVADELEVKFAAGTDPAVGTGHTFSYRLRCPYGEHSVKVELMQGATRIAWWSEDALTASFQTLTHTLTTAEADAITNYADLRLRFTAVASFITDAAQPFPFRAVALYHPIYANSTVQNLDDYYFPSNINVVYLAFAFGSPLALAGYTAEGQTIFVNRLRRLRRSGVRVILSVGGAGNVVSTTNTTNFVNEVMAINATIPIDGLDWDLEASSMVQADVLAISASLRSTTNRGPDFAITMAPNGSNAATYLTIAKALQDAGNLTMYGYQFYDVAITEQQMMDRLSEAVSAGLTQDHIGIGMMADQNASGPTAYWDVNTCVSRVQAAHRTYPYLRGGYLWVDQLTTAALSWADLAGTELMFVPSPPPILVAGWTYDVTVESWTQVSNATSVRSTTTPRTGAGCLQVTAPGAGNSVIWSPLTACTAGEMYTAYVWVRPEVGNRDYFGYFEFFDAATAGLPSSDGDYRTPTLNTYTLSTWTWQAPAGAAYMKIVFYSLSAVAGDRYRVDDISIYKPA